MRTDCVENAIDMVLLAGIWPELVFGADFQGRRCLLLEEGRFFPMQVFGHTNYFSPSFPLDPRKNFLKESWDKIISNKQKHVNTVE